VVPLCCSTLEFSRVRPADGFKYILQSKSSSLSDDSDDEMSSISLISLGGKIDLLFLHFRLGTLPVGLLRLTNLSMSGRFGTDFESDDFRTDNSLLPLLYLLNACSRTEL